MAMSSEELLAQLELVMTEFFTGNTSNERKREIESQLNAVWLQPDAWRHCIYCISHTSNGYVAMACITALENLINRQVGNPLNGCELAEIRQNIMTTLRQKHLVLQTFVRNKLMKVVVDVARVQWPHEYSTFMQDIMMLGEQRQEEGCEVLCLLFLQVATEELAIKEHQLMPHARKVQLRQQLHSHAPHMLSYITGVLERLLVCNRSNQSNKGTTTPPPSPSHSPSSPASPAPPAPSPVAQHLDGVLRMLEHRSASHYETWPPWLQIAVNSPPTFDAAADNTAYAALDCLSQLMAWIPLELLAEQHFKVLDLVFTFAALAGLQTVNQNSSSNTVSISALSCIQELLSRPCIPPSVDGLLLHVLHFCSVLVHHLLVTAAPRENGDQPLAAGVGGVPAAAAKQRLASLHPTYLDKVTELVRLFVSSYFRRFEHHPQFNVEEFLALLFRFSFSHPSLDGYLECLEIWSMLLEHIWSKSGYESSGIAPHIMARYCSVLELLVEGVLHKIQLRHNQCELEELDYDLLEEAGQNDVDDCPSGGFSDAWEDQQPVWSGPGGGGVEHLTEQSECQSFFSHNLDLLARLADIMPDKVMDMLVPAWQENCAVYLNVETTLHLRRVPEPGGGTSLRISSDWPLSEDVLLNVHCGLRDLCTLLQLLGRLATTFLGTQLVPRASVAMATLQRLVELGQYGMRHQLYSLDTTIELLRADLIQVHCEVLCSLRAWSHWLSQLYGKQFVESRCSTESPSLTPPSSVPSPPPDAAGKAKSNNGTSSVVSTHPHLHTCHSLNRELLVLAAAAVHSASTDNVPWVVVRCGVQLLLTVSVLVVSPVALQVPQVQLLYSAPVYSNTTPPGKVREMLYRALVNFLLLPWPAYSVQQEPAAQHSAQDRQRMLVTFMELITQPISAQDPVQLAADPALREKASGGIKACLRLVRSQLCQLTGADKASRELYWSCVREPLNKTMVQLLPLYCNSPGVLLEMVGMVMWCVGVVGGNGCSEVFTWIESLVHLVMSPQYLAPALANDQSPQAAVLARFLQLLSLVLSDPSPGFKRLVGVVVGTLDDLYPQVSQQPAATAIRQPLFAVLRTLLEHNWKFFYRSSVQQPLSHSAWEEVQHGEHLTRILQAFGQSFMQTDIAVFRQNLAALQLLNAKFRLYSKNVFRPMLSQFITVLLQVLLHGSHALLQDEIISCVYNMASVDLGAFTSQFLETFLRNMHDLTDEQRVVLKRDFSTDSDLPTFSQSIQRLINDLRYYRTINAHLVPQ